MALAGDGRRSGRTINRVDDFDPGAIAERLKQQGIQARVQLGANGYQG